MLPKSIKDTETLISQPPKCRANNASDVIDLYKSKQELVEKLTTIKTDLENLESYDGAKKRTEDVLRKKIKKFQKDISSVNKKIRQTSSRNDNENSKYKYGDVQLKGMEILHEEVPERSSIIAENFTSC